MYRLFIANKNYSSWSLRPWVLMRERGIPFTEEQVRFTSSDNWGEFRSFSPTGQVPCLHDDASVVWDSLGIALYLAERHEGIWPSDAAARAWAGCAAAEMHAGFAALRNRCTMNCGLRIELTELPDPLRRDIRRLDELWRDGLDRFGGPFLAGADFSAVDAFFAPVAFRIQTYGLELSQPALAYAHRLRGLPAMQDWYKIALADPSREADHERDAMAAGRIVQDLRATAV